MKPSKVLLIYACILALLGAVCWLVPSTSYVRIPELSEVLDWHPSSMLTSEHASDEATIAQASAPNANTSTQAGNQTAEAALVHASDLVAADTLAQASVHPIDSATEHALQAEMGLALPHFYHALSQSDHSLVRIVHYGDSQIEEDRISMIVRQRLQERFGGGGTGLVPMVQTIPTYTTKQSLQQDGHDVAWSAVSRHIVYGPSSMRLTNAAPAGTAAAKAYGPMGQVAHLRYPTDVTLNLLRDRVKTYPFSHIRVLTQAGVHVQAQIDSLYVAAPIDSVRTLQDDSISSLASADSIQGQHDSLPSDKGMLQQMLTLPYPVSNVCLHFTGEGDVYGISLETTNGVQVDNIPMRGAAGTMFYNIDATMLTQYFAQSGTQMIIMQYGGNAMPSIRSKAAVNNYVQAMRQQIRYLRACAPKVSLLFIGPSDMITSIDGVQQTYPMLPTLDRALQEMVEEEGGAYWSLFRVMGGAGSMKRWYEKGLAGEDMVHFTRAGAKKVGEMLAKQLLNDYDAYMQQSTYTQPTVGVATDSISEQKDEQTFSQEE